MDTDSVSVVYPSTEYFCTRCGELCVQTPDGKPWFDGASGMKVTPIAFQCPNHSRFLFITNGHSRFTGVYTCLGEFYKPFVLVERRGNAIK